MSKSFNIDLKGCERITEILKGLANPMRLCIVRTLIESGVLNVSELQNFWGFPQSTTSTQLMRLRQYNIVNRERKGTEIYYRVDDPMVIEVIKTLGL
ncbi:ArsR/SmtB family transcription factor [Bacillus thuringiensis]|uniref:ArsR/SmtB family transcription factor n=1 Tax=Bacillus thuringiensis TaxID=1428 RepID=UPI0011A15910|nr:metalloregulator ArsR/SmtB family transcription factor [Bacillus thuringiensis]